MTISSNVGRELDFTTLILRAHQLAGLMPAEQGPTGAQWAARAAMAVDFLQLILSELQAEGFFARHTTFYELALVDGTSAYALPDGYFDVSGDGTIVDEASLLVKQVDRETWHRVVRTATEGTPTLFYVDRSVFPVVVNVWTTPDAAMTLRLQVLRILANVELGKTPDLERTWHAYLLHELAGYLASAASNSENAVRFSSIARAKKQQALVMANQHTENQMYMDHRTPWGGR